jgi:hypothetical protein
VPEHGYGWFLLISLAIFVVAVTVATTATYAIAPPGSETRQFASVAGLLFFPLYLLCLSLFGTTLPASVARAGNYRLAMGMRVTLGTMWRLIAGPALVFPLLLAPIFAIDWLAKGIPALQGAIGQIVIGALITTIVVLPSVMAVAVLCHMYQKITPAAAV